MKSLILILIILVPFLTKAQITLIPDQDFEQRLVDLNIDSDGVVNGQILTNDALAVTDLLLWGAMIFDLTGLEYFVNVEKLNCGYNPLNGYDLPPYGTIDVSTMPYLKELNVAETHLDTIDLSNNILLEKVFISNGIGGDILIINNFTKLDLSNNPKVEYVDAYNLMNFNFLNLRNNSADSVYIKLGNMSYVPYNVCIEVDDHTAAANGTVPYDTWVVDGNHFFSDDCKKALSNEIFIQNNFKIYPNPAMDYVTIEYDENAGVQLQAVQILDNSGKWIRSVNENFHQINVSGLSEGVYLFIIQTDKGNKTEKVVVK